MRVLITVLVTFLVFFTLVHSVQAVWWNSSFESRRQITITNINATDALPANFTYNFTIDTSTGRFNTDCSDIRIIKDHSLEMSWFNLTGCGNSVNLTIIDFKLNSSLAAGTGETSYWIYYNNSNANVPSYNWSDVYAMDADGSFSSKDTWQNGSNYTTDYNIVNNRIEMFGMLRKEDKYLLANYSHPELKEFVLRFEFNTSHISSGTQADFLIGMSNESNDDFHTSDYAIGSAIHIENGASNLSVLGVWWGKTGEPAAGWPSLASPSVVFAKMHRVFYGEIIRNSTCGLKYSLYSNPNFTGHVGVSPVHLQDETCDYVNYTYALTGRMAGDTNEIHGTIDNVRQYLRTYDAYPTITIGSIQFEELKITSPENRTYYNNFTLLFEGTMSSIDSDTWLFNLDDGDNITIPNATSGVLSFSDVIVGKYGVNKLALYANDTSGVWYNDTVYFTIKTKCNATFSADTICGGDNANYAITCRQQTKETYQWDYSNMTYCKYGCRSGICHTPDKTCKDNCIQDRTMCMDSSNFVYCVNNSEGCYDWSNNKTYCQFGCLEGQCLGGISYCNEGDRKCEYKTITTCADDDGDGFFEWSDIAKEQCTLGCIETINDTSGFVNITCNVHSFGDIYAWRNYFTYYGRGFNYIFDSIALRLATILIFMILFGMLIGWKVSSIAGIISAIGVLFIGFFIWMPQLFFILILLIIIGGGILFYVNIKEE